MTKLYTVVENAGYEGEQDIKSFHVAHDAYAFIKRHYQDDEAETLHVMVALDLNGERTYEL